MSDATHHSSRLHRRTHQDTSVFRLWKQVGYYLAVETDIAWRKPRMRNVPRMTRVEVYPIVKPLFA